MKRIETLKQFYDLMFETRDTRARVVCARLGGASVLERDAVSLARALDLLRDIPRKGDRYRLQLGPGRQIDLDLSYEITELEKDIHFLAHTEEAFYNYLRELHRGFEEGIDEGRRFMDGVRFFNFITDRDGTVNNYCGRYRSSIQSAYNAVFLSRFAMHVVEHAVLLSSAPLVDEGLVDISALPPGVFIYAGSKGRELMNTDGKISRYPIERQKQHRLDLLNERLSDLVKRPEYEAFGLIGSGLQFKFGQSTIARQDIYGSIPEQESERFLETVGALVEELDPEGAVFRIEDTGKDIEIILTVQGSGAGESARDFDKGDGVSFLSRELGLQLERGPNLICGDTRSDVPMVAASLERTKETWAVFVTGDAALQEEVRSLCTNSLFLPEPDMLVALLDIRGREVEA